MDIKVNTRSAGKRELITVAAMFLAKQLKIDRSRWTLEIQTMRGLAKNDNMRGAVIRMGPKYVLMMIDSQLDIDNLFNTLSHEMVHVKQFVRKEMVINVTPKRSTYYWKGQRVVADYYNQPWEIEAWKKERLLATRIYAIFNE